MNFSSLINQIAKRLPEKVALIEGRTSITYNKLWSTVEAVTNSLFEVGLKKGDKIVLILPNCREFIYCFFAILRADIIVVPLNPSLSPHEIRTVFDDCKPKAIITNPSILSKIAARNEAVLKDKIIIVHDGANIHSEKIYSGPTLTLEKLYSPKKRLPIHKFATNNNQVASINYTYRGYGYPLGTLLTHGNYIHGAVGYIRLVEPSLDQKFLLAMPISHIFTLIGCVVVPLLRGATVVIMKNIIPSHIFKAIKDNKIDFLVGVPTFYKVLSRNYDDSKYDISSVKYGISGGAPLDRALYDEVKARLKFQLIQGYGLTETLPVVCNPKKKVKPTALGIPGHEVKIKIVDENGARKKPGELGEILIGGPTIMKGYFNRRRESEDVLKDGWVYTGDIGMVDKDGYLYFDSLKKDIAKVGGNTVDLQEIQKVLSSHPDVINTKIYSKINELWGSVIEAEVHIKQSATLSEKDMKDYCSERLAIYKIPRKIKIVRMKSENSVYIASRKNNQ